MKELLMALAVVINMLGGHIASNVEGVDMSDVVVNSTTTTTLIPRSVITELENCDRVPDRDDKNMCYAQAAGDRFFCDRILNAGLRDECLKNLPNKT